MNLVSFIKRMATYPSLFLVKCIMKEIGKLAIKSMMNQDFRYVYAILF